MKKNVGKTDKAIRVIVGIAGVALGYFVSPWFYILAVAGFATAACGYCGLYSLLGINTCPVKEEKKTEEPAEPVQEEQN